jgi:phenylacetate-CoA ligase
VKIYDNLRVMRHLIGLQRSQWWPEARTRRYQACRLVEMLQFAAGSVVYYNRLGIDPETIRNPADLERFPVLTKGLLQEHQQELFAPRVHPDHMNTSRTSGSTGEPTTTVFDKNAWLLCKYALKLRRLLAYGIGLGKRILLISEMHPEEIAATAGERLAGKGTLFQQEYLSVHVPVDRHIPVIQKFRPHAIYAFPSYLGELLEHCEKDNIVLPGVDVLFTSSEVLGDALRDRLAAFFDAQVCDVYGSTEFKEVAWQCPNHRYHINFESTWVECVEDGHNDGYGTVLLTTLVNRAMPLVRYRVGDRARLGNGKCGCGREGPWIESVTGREVDMLLLPDGRRISPYVLTSMVECDPAIRRYQLAQTGSNHLQVRYLAPDSCRANEARLARGLAALLDGQMQVELARVSVIPRTLRGKQQVFIREFDSVQLPKDQANDR